MVPKTDAALRERPNPEQYWQAKAHVTKAVLTREDHPPYECFEDLDAAPHC